MCRPALSIYSPLAAETAVTALLLYCCTAILLMYCSTVVLLYWCTTLLMYCSTDLMLYCCTSQLFCSYTFALFRKSSVFFNNCATKLLYYCTSSRLIYTYVLLFHCTVVLLFYRSVVNSSPAINTSNIRKYFDGTGEIPSSTGIPNANSQSVQIKASNTSVNPGLTYLLLSCLFGSLTKSDWWQEVSLSM